MPCNNSANGGQTKVRHVTISPTHGTFVVTVTCIEKWDWLAYHVAGLVTTAYLRTLYIEIVDITRYIYAIR